MSLPEPEEPPIEFISPLTGHQEWKPSKLISKAEWNDACKHDPFLLQLLDFVQQDYAILAQRKHELSEIQREVRMKRSQILKINNRVQSRKRQYKYFARLLRQKIAWAKIKKLRKEMNLD